MKVQLHITQRDGQWIVSISDKDGHRIARIERDNLASAMSAAAMVAQNWIEVRYGG